MPELVNKLKILKSPSKKSARDLLNSLNKEGYHCSVENRGEVVIRIDKKSVPMSLNDLNDKEKYEGKGEEKPKKVEEIELT